MFGYACTETPELMPLPIMLAHKLGRGLSRARRDGVLAVSAADGKSQVSVEYDKARQAGSHRRGRRLQRSTPPTSRPSRCAKTSSNDHRSDGRARRADRRQDPKFYINPTGRFVVGGPHGDAGLTGRKIIVDTYGGAAPHGGGAFSGKDPTKVDRSACYMARYIAKNVVAAGLAEKCTVQLAYAIGVADPVSVLVDTHGTGEDRRGEDLRDRARELQADAKGIIEELDLRRPIYKKTAAFGHFGREEDGFTWERSTRPRSSRPTPASRSSDSRIQVKRGRIVITTVRPFSFRRELSSMVGRLLW